MLSGSCVRLACILVGFFGKLNLLLAQTLGPSTQELKFSADLEFSVPNFENTPGRAEALAQYHFSHLFGILQAPEFVEEFRIDPEKIAGIGAPRFPLKIEIKEAKVGNSNTHIKYGVAGQMLFHKTIAELVALQEFSLELPMPFELAKIFDPICTDDYYNTLGDYWYFYNPFRTGCEYLQKFPYAKQTTFFFKPGTKRKLEEEFRLDLLKGNNGNGELFLVYIVHGFNENNKEKKDEGRLAFEKLNHFFVREKFKERILREKTTRPLHIFSKTQTLDSGREIKIEIHHLLAESSIESKTVSFAKFFKEAVEKGDVVIYAGHSGLGDNLDLGLLAQKAGEFEFDPKKRQVFYFEACSSYTYYLEPFLQKKTKAKIDVITNGLQSYYGESESVLKVFVGNIISTKDQPLRWLDLLKEMESPLKGGSYLLNVGGV